MRDERGNGLKKARPRPVLVPDENIRAIRELMADDARLPADLQPRLLELLREREAREAEQERERLRQKAGAELERAVQVAEGGDTREAIDIVIKAGRNLGLPEPRRRFGLGDALADRPPPFSVCPKLEWDVGRPPMLIGAPSAGKSLVILAAMLDMMAGGPIWGCPDFWVPRPCRTVFIDLDLGVERTMRRFKRLSRGRGVTAKTEEGGRAQLASIYRVDPRDLGVLDFDGGEGLRLGSLDPEELNRWRRAWVDAVRGYDLVAVDSLRRLAPFLDENDSRFSVVPDVLRLVSEEAGAVILPLHHATNKAPQNGRKRPPGSRGTSAIDGAAGSQFVIEDDDDNGARTVTQIRAGDAGKIPPFCLVIEVDPPGDDGEPGIRVVYRTMEQVKRRDQADDGGKAQLLRALVREVLITAGAAGLCVGELRAAVRAAGGKGRNTAIDAAAGELVKAREATTRADSSNSTRYYAA